MLLNFSADLTRRTAGALKAGRMEHEALPVMDRTCGGRWWRRTALDAHAASPTRDFEAAASAVVDEYANRLAAACRMRSITVPVRKRVHHQPIYHLVFLTRRDHGVWVFGTALAAARQSWMRALGPVDDDAAGALFTFATAVEGHIALEQHRAEEAVSKNVAALLAKQPLAHLVNQPGEIFGESYGIATESTVRQALIRLEQQGKIRVAQRRKQLRDWVITQP
jgi:hypothetical protein